MEQTKYDVFISYSRRDLNKVKAIKSEIEQVTRMECWMDLKDIQADEEDYLNRIAEGIEKCRVFLFMLSKSSQEAEHAIGELVAATKQQRKRGIHVVIINIDGCEMITKFTIRFTTKDVILWSDTPQKDKLMRNLRDWLGVEEEERKMVEEAKKIDNESIVNDTSVNRKKQFLWTQKRRKWLVAAFLTIAAIIGFSVYAYLYRHRIVEKFGESEGMVLVKNAMGYYGFASMTGKEVIPCQWDSAISFSGGLAAVRDDKGNWGYIDKMGKVVSSCQWKDAKGLSEGFAIIENYDNKFGFIDKTGKEVIPCKWNGAGCFSEGMAPVKDSNGKCGFIDMTGKLVIPCRWNSAGGFSEGLARVQNDNGKWGYIDKNGIVVIPFQWKNARYFSEGLALVLSDDGMWQKIDKTGKIVP